MFLFSIQLSKNYPFFKIRSNKEKFQITISDFVSIFISKWHYLNVSFFNTTLQKFSFFQNWIEKREIQMVPISKKENLQKKISGLESLLISKWYYLNVSFFN